MQDYKTFGAENIYTFEEFIQFINIQYQNFYHLFSIDKDQNFDFKK